MRPYSKKEKGQRRPYSKDDEWLDKFNITFDEFETTLKEKIKKYCNEPNPQRLNERVKDVINYVRYVTGESRLGGWMGDKPLPARHFMAIMSKLEKLCSNGDVDYEMQHARIKDITNYVTFASTGGKRTRKRRTQKRRTRRTRSKRRTQKRRKRNTRSKRGSTTKRHRTRSKRRSTIKQ